MDREERLLIAAEEWPTRLGFAEQSIDLQTVCRAMEGDKEAFTTLFRQTYRRMYGVVREYLWRDDDIYDALQIGYTKAYKYIRRLSPPELFYPWLKKTIENAAKDVLRDVHAHQEIPLEQVEIPVDDHAEDCQRRVELREVLKAMDPRRAEVLALYYYDGLKLREIAALLNEPISTVHSRLKAAKRELFALLEQRGIDRSVYGGTPATAIAVALRSILGTDILSAAVAQKMLDEITEGKTGRLEAAACKLIQKRRDRAILRIASLLMVMCAGVTVITVALINGWPRRPVSIPAVTTSTTTVSETTTVFGTTTTATTFPTTTTTAAFVPDYRPGMANVQGNTKTNILSDGRVAMQDEWLYYCLGNGYRYLMKQRIDGNEKQMLAELDALMLPWLNVQGDWIYYNNSGVWRMRTDGTGEELLSARNGWLIWVKDDLVWYGVESGDQIFTVYCLDPETKKEEKVGTAEGVEALLDAYPDSAGEWEVTRTFDQDIYEAVRYAFDDRFIYLFNRVGDLCRARADGAEITVL